MSEQSYIAERTADLQPGQLWLIEHAEATQPPPCDQRALRAADVVLYERSLAPLLPRLLPGAAYTEPLAAAGAAPSRRALTLAADGWRVAQLVAGGRERQGTAAALTSFGCPEELPVLVIDKTGRHPTQQASLRSLSALIEAVDGGDLLTLVFGPVKTCHLAGRYAAAGNGLAG